MTDDGASLWYVDHGPRDSSALFLIHGDPMSSKFWRRNIGVLARQHRVIAMDIRGRGESAKVEGGHNLARYATDFHQVLDSLALERVVAVGWSIAGFVLFEYLRRFGPEHLAGLVIVDQPPLTFVSEEDLASKVRRINGRRMETARDWLRVLHGPEAHVDSRTLDWMAAEMMKTPPSCQIPALNDAYHSDFRPDFENIRLPTLICWARYGSIRPEAAEMMEHAIRNSRLAYFERSGHLLPWTEADKFNQELSTFAASVLM